MFNNSWNWVEQNDHQSYTFNNFQSFGRLLSDALLDSACILFGNLLPTQTHCSLLWPVEMVHLKLRLLLSLGVELSFEFSETDLHSAHFKRSNI